MCLLQLGIRFSLLLVAVVAGLVHLPRYGSSQHQEEGQNQYLHSSSEMQCWSGLQLALAIADPAVTTALLMRDVKLVDDDFAAVQQQPRPPGLIVIKRNFTVRGVDDKRPKLLDFNYLLVKIQLLGGMTLGLQNLFMVNYRRGSATQQPGLDVLTAARDASGRVPIVEMRDCFILYKYCFPPRVGSEAFSFIKRPDEVAGNNTFQVPYPSPYTCESAGAAATVAAVVAAPPPTLLPLPQQQPAAAPPDGDPLALYGCFKHVVLYIDAAVYGGDMDDNGRPISDSTNYPVLALNTKGMCQDVLSMACIAKYGPLGCLLYTLALPGKAPEQQTQQEQAAPLSEPVRRGGAQSLEVVLGVTIGGGVALLLGTAVVGFVVVARRRRGRRLDEEADTAACAKRTASGAPACNNTDGLKEDITAAEAAPAAAMLANRLAPLEAAAGGWTAAIGSVSVTPPPLPPWTSETDGNLDGNCRQAQLGGGGEGGGQRLAVAAFVTGQGDPSARVAAAVAADDGAARLTLDTKGVTGSGEETVALLSLMATTTAVQLQPPPAPPLLPPAGLDDAHLVTPATPLRPGIKLDVVLDEQVKLSGVTLGKGAFGRVVEGSYCGQLVAVKIIDHGLLCPHQQRQQQQQQPISAVAAAAAVAGNSLAAWGYEGSGGGDSGDGAGYAAAAAFDLTESEEPGLMSVDSSRCNGVLQEKRQGVSATAAAGGCSFPCSDGGSGGGDLDEVDGTTAAAIAAAAANPPIMRHSSANAGVIGGSGGTAATAVVTAAAVVCVSSTSIVIEANFEGPPHSSWSTPYCGSSATMGKASAPDTAADAADAADAANELQQQPAWKMPCTAVDPIHLPPPPSMPPTPLSAHLPSLESTLKQEVEVLARCQHPNIVRLLAACLKPPRFCMVMELMETSLDRLLYDGRQRPARLMPLDMVLNIGTQIAQGLAYLHPTVIHRDLKPANVLISNSSQGRPLVKLADFGLSRLLDTVLITRNPEVGTAPYISPEAFDVCNICITDRVDIYALGIMLWEMLSGCRPWSGHNIVVIAFNVSMYRRRPPLDAVPPGRCPPQLRALIESCWDHVPERRPAAAEVAKRLALIRQEKERQAKTGGATLQLS